MNSIFFANLRLLAQAAIRDVSFDERAIFNRVLGKAARNLFEIWPRISWHILAAACHYAFPAFCLVTWI